MAKKIQKPPQNRAISAAAKFERRNQILQAANELVKRHGLMTISVADVARQAGVAKGTVYLYFKTKEEIYLGLHQLWLDRKFDAFHAMIQDPQPIDGSNIGATMAKAMLAESHGLVIASTCHSLMESHIDLETALDFKLKLAQRLGTLGTLLEKRFGHLIPGSGARLLVRAYAMTLGLWQLMDTTSRYHQHETLKGVEVFNTDFATELHAALAAFWHGALDDLPKRKST
ncbi:MAG: TetR family transcriptional regulator [Gammaproteobacteria bacterium]|nr:TetR family transcriptional regulator [Gammaproteobacteria bacterium]